MACPLCGKRVQGANVLWTHMVFKNPDKANNYALDDKNPSKRKKTMKCQKEIAIEKNNVINTKEKTPGRKKINIEVDEGILDRLMEQMDQ